MRPRPGGLCKAAQTVRATARVRLDVRLGELVAAAVAVIRAAAVLGTVDVRGTIADSLDALSTELDPSFGATTNYDAGLDSAIDVACKSIDAWFR